MSQDDQRNQSNEEAAGREPDASRGARDAAASEPAAPSGVPAGEAEGGTAAGTGATAVGPMGAAGSTAMTGSAGGDTSDSDDSAETAETTDTAAAGAPTALPTDPEARRAALRREFHDPGEGALRYADPGMVVPGSGSEQSWSAQPNPGYEADPRRRATSKRVAAGSLVGLVVLAAGAFFGYSLLTYKSSNGNGSAPWTGAVRQNGAVVGGINAQNNDAAPAIDVPAGVTYPASGTPTNQAVNNAIEKCRVAQSTVVPVTTEPGTAVTIGNWAVNAHPDVTLLRSNAAALETAIGTDDVTQVANAAANLCAGYPAIHALPPMPDAVGSQAWSAATVAYSIAATDALRGVSGTIAAKPAALDNLATGHAELEALNARVTEATGTGFGPTA